MTLTEKTYRYNPTVYLQERYASWWLAPAEFPSEQNRGDHMVCAQAKIIFYDVDKFCGDHDWALAHLAYHLDHHMHRISKLTLTDCYEADSVVEILLDRPESRPV